MLAVYRDDDINFDLDDRLPDEATPELLMEAINCNLRWMRYKLRVSRLAEYITENEMVCEYVNYYDDSIDLTPTEFVLHCDGFTFTDKNGNPLDNIDIFLTGLKSAQTFSPYDEYCWFDPADETMHSTNTPFKDKILDAEGFAEFILKDSETLKYITDDMEETEIQYIFLCSKDELMRGVI